MKRFRQLLVMIVLTSAAFPAAQADDKTAATAKKPAATDASAKQATKSVAELAKQVRKSVVVVSFSGRDGKQAGLGTGFIVSADGLIATNLHVIGEARPIVVRMVDGKEYAVKSVHATQRSMDLALLRIDAKNLPALELGNSDDLKQGQPIVAIGNPLGLKHSVVSGVVSGRREIDGKPMIQLAIPIERGNSGGPLLDMQGRVHGILTLKSLVTENLGFAVAVNALKPLLKKPNPVPMSRWLTIGTVDPKEWTTLFGASWRQRAGRILVEGQGQGFGGRSLNLSHKKVPEVPFEVAVQVRFNPDDGAAGLVFHADGGQKHYGFYPSSGSLRLSRFDGPDVFFWKVLKQIKSRHYRQGEWNALKVRVEKDKIKCFINDELVIESTDAGFTSGRVGLAKFRHTSAEFKGFQVAKTIPSSRPSAETVERIAKLVTDISAERLPTRELAEKLIDDTDAPLQALRERARMLERQAERLRQLALAVHQKKVQKELKKLLSAKEQDVDLLKAALLIAKLDNDELDINAYLGTVNRMAGEIAAMAGDKADERTRLKSLNKYLFAELGYHGSRTDYYNSSNSYLNEVIDDREGLPITLSVLYMSLAQKARLNVVGIGLPGHFVVRHEPRNEKDKQQGQLIDVFDSGKQLSREQAADMVRGITNLPFADEYLEPQSKQAIVVRMLRNLMGVARDRTDAEAMLRYVDTILVIEPDSAQDRWFRAVLNFQTERIDEAKADADWLLEHHPDGINLQEVRRFLRVLEESAR